MSTVLSVDVPYLYSRAALPLEERYYLVLTLAAFGKLVGYPFQEGRRFGVVVDYQVTYQYLIWPTLDDAVQLVVAQPKIRNTKEKHPIACFAECEVLRVIWSVARTNKCLVQAKC